MSGPNQTTHVHRGHEFKITICHPIVFEVELSGRKGAVRYHPGSDSNRAELGKDADDLGAFAAELSMSARASRLRETEAEALAALCDMLIEGETKHGKASRDAPD